MAKERRKSNRARVISGGLPPAALTLFKPFFHEPFDVEILDLSLGGMRIKSPEIIPLFFTFALDFKAAGAEVFQCEACAVHQQHNDSFYEIGISFQKVEEPMKELMSGWVEDYYRCEDRINKAWKEVCIKECRFLTLCHKPQKAW